MVGIIKLLEAVHTSEHTVHAASATVFYVLDYTKYHVYFDTDLFYLVGVKLLQVLKFHFIFHLYTGIYSAHTKFMKNSMDINRFNLRYDIMQLENYFISF